MTSRPGVFNLTGKYAIYSGSDWEQPFGFHEGPLYEGEPGGRIIDDLVLVDGDASVTSETAAFTDNDIGRKISTESGEGIDDGTTIDAVLSETEVELSAAATADGIYVATVRSINLTNYSAHKAQLKRATGQAAICEFTFNDDRKAVGWVVPSLQAATTEPLSGTGVYDWRAEGPNGRSFLMRGKFELRKNVTEDDA